MSENTDKDSKTEEATDKKVRDALEKGNVPFSKELPVFGSLAALIVITAFFIVGSAIELAASLKGFLDNPGKWQLENTADVVQVFGAVNLDAAKLVLPVVLILAAAGLGSSLIQNQPRMVIDRVQPKLSRISLKSGWKRLFGVQGWIEFLKGTSKFIILACLAYVIMRAARYDVFNSMFMSPYALPGLLQGMIIWLFASVVVGIMLLVILDLLWSRFYWRRELRMTKQEVKDEHKQSDGDPIVKSRMRSLARDRARKRMIARVPEATVVIVNPTHYAIALRYVRTENQAPVVVAKGLDIIALKIRSIAEEHDIPVVEDKLLARSLYDKVEIDQLIPPEFYRAVANVILYLMSRGKPVPSSGSTK
ncbi:flagellar biosynthesis protein FlhB [Hyphomicrobium sulfonivorans]|uniref:Flagellar biosynthetic protein FlhB n=1 Tax=Hyphomicrobium sulfonivorans TaxID=121290 RepID=A0A109BF84_HYPSL|nr:flagellar biosynthesis protein FlhB [Hyphomicrobium sulfonivorans]KWT67445.1 Flagellar biosynthesis protein FlhB [Hyphomicrobium sulfonivorans]MBI1648761.1 flagellar biosynthesis protein FlhB [Hyphomicrobium sulfonivorans]NSL70704.1 flagellar biosynthesis protein FlhB [Hyphomicrobium sulfonivorans]